MLYYLIYDIRANTYILDSRGRAIRESTIADCIDYLEYILKVDVSEFQFYEFILTGTPDSDAYVNYCTK